MEQTPPPMGDQPHPPAGASGYRPGGQPGPPAPPGPQAAPGSDGFYDSVRRIGLVRTQERWIGGVAGGLARRFGIDPLLVRGVLGATVLLGGVGLVLYGLAWALLPEEVDGRIHLQETFAGRFDAAILGALAFVIVGANRGAGWNGWWHDNGFGWVEGVLWLGVVVAAVAIVISVAGGRRSRAVAPGDPAAAWAAVPPPPPGGRTVPHPGYGAVPLAAPAPAAGAWAGSTPSATSSGPPAGYGGYGGPGGAGGYGGPPAGAAAYRTPQPVRPPVPPRPPRPRVLGPGVGMVGTVAGLTLLALATLLVVEREGVLGGSVALTALGVGIVLAGLGIIVSGLRGRRSGVLGLLAVVGILASLPVAFGAGQDGRFGFISGGGSAGISSGDDVWRPASVAEAERGLSVGVGDVNVDLTDVPLGTGRVDVPISLGAGDLEVVVPDDVAVAADVSLQAGQIQWAVGTTSQSAGITGARGFEHFESDQAADGDVRLAIRITAGAGDVRVVEEDR